uniref:Uncharacterized protein n=1 Tax=Meloidogyne floridensis TaxID=298350 RepID=A0A915NK67_9BILA
LSLSQVASLQQNEDYLLEPFTIEEEKEENFEFNIDLETTMEEENRPKMPPKMFLSSIPMRDLVVNNKQGGRHNVGFFIFE